MQINLKLSRFLIIGCVFIYDTYVMGNSINFNRASSYIMMTIMCTRISICHYFQSRVSRKVSNTWDSNTVLIINTIFTVMIVYNDFGAGVRIHWSE